MYISSPGKRALLYARLAFTTLILSGLAFNPVSQAQPATNGEMSTCTVITKKKAHQLKPNQIGYFDRIAGIEPLEIIPVTISYPFAREGEKVVLSALDGGKFDTGKMVKVAQLDNQKKCTFNFQVSDQLGIYRVSLRKGSDTKVVQLWVGAEPTSVNQ